MKSSDPKALPMPRESLAERSGIASAEFIEQVVAFIQGALPPGFVQTAKVNWHEQVSQFLRLGSTARADEVGPVAQVGLRTAIARLSMEARNEHLRQMGLVAKAAAFLALVHRHPRHNPIVSMRAATVAFDQLQASNVSGDRIYSLVDSVGIWVLTSMHLNYRQIASFQHFPLSREMKREAAGISRWTSGLLSERQNDIAELMKGNVELDEFAMRVTQLMKTSWAQLEQLNVLGAEVALEPEECDCSDPIDFIELIWLGATGAAWSHFPTSTSEAGMVQKLVAASAPRSDFLVLGDEAMVLDPPGFFDALLVLAAAHATDKTNSHWHESSILAEVRRTWMKQDRILVNVPWVSDPDRLKNQAPDERHHDGELDIAVIKDGIIFDFQAKSARSVDYVNRERLPARAALEQHKNLRAKGASGIWTVRSGQDRAVADTLLLDEALSIGIGGLVHIPISVGTEEVHGWSVGASLFDEAAFPRVMTTLDHLRLVNEYVPAHFREVYWIDRYSQEFGLARFINEMDYLEKWHALLRSEPDAHTAMGPNHLVLASDGPIESDVIVRNSEEGSGLEPGSLRNPARLHLSEQGPNRQIPKLNRVLRSVIEERVPGAIGLVRAVLGSNMRAAETAMIKKRDVLLNSPLGKWAMVHRAPGPTNFESSDAEVVLYSDRAWGAWRIWEREPWQRELSSQSTATIRVRFAATDRRE